MRLEFDFKSEDSGLFGRVLRPVARLFLMGETNKEIPGIFYIDSGADISLIPKSLGELLDFRIDDPDDIKEIKGVGERGIPVVVKNAQIKFDNRIIKARIAWSLIEEVPPLLGRLDVFKLFNITFQKETKVIFED